MTSCLERRFVDNPDLQAYAQAEELILHCHSNKAITESEWLATQCELVTSHFKDVDCAGLQDDIMGMTVYLKAQATSGSESTSTVSKKILQSIYSLADYSSYVHDQGIIIRSLFPHLVKLLQLLNIVPATSATAERSFSCLRRVKTWLRSSMTQTRLNSAVVLHANRHINPDIDSVINDFISLNDLRRRIFGASAR